MALPNFSQYVVPGTYWNATPTPVSSLALSTTSVVGIIGPGIGYRTFTDILNGNLVLSGTNPVGLSQYGIDTTTLVVTSPDGSTIYDPSVYTVTQIPAVAGLPNADSTVDLARASGGGTGAIPDGSAVTVTYQYTDGNYLAPTRATSLTDVQNLYGNAIDVTTGDILSPISFAAQFAINAGASQLVLVATPNETVNLNDLTTAYASLSAYDDVNIVVPLPVNMLGTPTSVGDTLNVAQQLSSFVDNQESENDVLQIGIIGFESSNYVGPDLVAEATNDARVLIAWPNQMLWFNGYLNTTEVVSGYYLAAVYAGTLASNPPQQGLTRLTIRGFSGIAPSLFQTMTKSYKDQLSGSGVAVTELSRSGVLWCRHGTTSAPGSVYTAELSLTRCQDAMVELLEESVAQAGIIGTPIGPNTIASLQALATGVLNTCVDVGIIEAYSGISAVEQSTNPTIVLVSFQYQPSYPLNYIDFVFSVNTTTGTVSSGTTTSTTA